MPYVRCMDCRQLVPLGERDAHRKIHRHQKGKDNGWSSVRHRGDQKRFRRKVLQRDGHSCTFILPSKLRCGVTEDLIAHHLVPLAKGGGFEPDNGVTLCRPHHREVDRYAR